MPVHRTGSVSRSRGRSQRRKLVWATSAVLHNGVAAGGKFNDDLLLNLKVVGSSVLGATIMRTHLRIAVADNPTGGPSMGGYLGLIVSTAPTVTNLDPSVAFADDWLLNSSMGPTHVPGNSILLDATHIAYGVYFDIRAKRKIQELNEVYFLCFTNTGANAINVQTFVKTLVALP
jgi:hypothetical protein